MNNNIDYNQLERLIKENKYFEFIDMIKNYTITNSEQLIKLLDLANSNNSDNSFTFRDISKEAMILLVESMAVMLGLDPYAKVGT